jgi:uncharacterized membrane protein YraQ (UPF0718 family)
MNKSMIFLLVMTIALIAVAYFRTGDFSLVNEGFGNAWKMGVDILPLLVIAFTMAGMVQVAIPAELTAKWIGTESGVRGLLLASGLGAVMPGGPMTSFPIVAALLKAGADIAPIAAFVFSWSIIGVHRMIIWEMPLMGPKFTFSRLAAGILIPPFLGLLTKAIYGLMK